MCWSIGDGVADNFADFEGAGLVEEEHGCCCRCSRSFAYGVQASDWVWMEFGEEACHKSMVDSWDCKQKFEVCEYREVGIKERRVDVGGLEDSRAYLPVTAFVGGRLPKQK